MNGLITAEAVLHLVEAFEPGPDDLAQKSHELITGMLRHTEQPFSRNQFIPGHITCTALVFHPTENSVLFMHHHRLNRWLLPGGHVEPEDTSPDAAAAREAREETHVQLDSVYPASLAGIDVHGIPPRRDEPYHLHHDLIWCFRASSFEIAVSDEAPAVRWATPSDWDDMGVAESIRRSIRRSC